MMFFVIALAGCAADSTTDGDTLGHGTLTDVRWGGGLCQANYSCIGSIHFGVSGFVAKKIDDTQEIARGELLPSERDLIDHFVAAIPLSEPTGVFMEDGGDAGKVEVDIRRDNEIRIYYTNGFRGDFGVYLADLRTSIGACGADVALYDSCTPQN